MIDKQIYTLFLLVFFKFSCVSVVFNNYLHHYNMAVYAAHLTRTLQGTPSIFQVAAQEALGSTVKPALRKVAEYLAAVYPGECGWCVRWYDELYLLFDGCLQYYYLKHYAASFSESFYGLLRVPTQYTSEFSSGQRLPASLERASLALLVLAPYLADKLEQLVDAWRDDDAAGRLGKSRSDRVRRAAVRVYSVVYTAGAVARLAQLARYCAGAAASPAPALAALGLALRPAPPAPPAARWGDFFRTLLTGHIGSAAASLPDVGGALLAAAQYGAFGVQFLRWWDSHAHHTTTHQLPPPTPPQRDERSVRWRNKCPLCLQPWKTPTVLPVSGYVFCYTCIARHVRARAACPATRLPASEQDLVRLYID